MSKRMLLAATLLVSVAAGAQEPQWLTDARAREGKYAAAEIKSKDKWFKAKVPAKVVGAIEKEEGSYTVALNLGSEQPAYCEVVPDGFDLADMLRRNLENTMGQVEKAQGKVEMRSLESVDAGAWGGVPYLEARWIYRVNDGTAQRIGGIKQVSMEKDGQGIYCAHVDIGYVKTFQAVAKGFAETFATTTPAPAPYYHEIAVASVAGKKLGLAITTLVKDADGDTEAKQYSSFLIPAPEGALHSQDAVHQEWVRPDASLINATHITADDGELTTNLALKVADEAWVIDGEHESKTISEKLKPDAQPGSWIAQAFALRKLMGTDGAVGSEHITQQWLDLDPTRLMDAKTKIVAKAGERQFKATGTAGEFTADLLLDKSSGMMHTAELVMGGQKILIERVYVNGEF